MDFLSNEFVIKNDSKVSGLTLELNVLYILNLFNKEKKNVLVVTNSLYESNKLFSSLSTYTDKVLFFPMDDFLASVALALSPDLKIKRLESIEEMKNGNHIVVTNLMGYLRYLPSLSEKREIKIKLNDNISRDSLIADLERLGYSRDSIVTSTGTYAVRGFILDVFPSFMDHPIRIEFFGDCVDSIRYFDESTQLSLEKKEEVLIKPFLEIVNEDKSSLLDYLKDNYVVFYDYQQISAGYEKLGNEIFEYNKSNDTNIKYMYDLEELNPVNKIYIDSIENKKDDNSIVYSSKEVSNFKSDFNKLKDYVIGVMLKKKIVIFCLSLDSQIKEIRELFDNAVIVNNNLEKERVNIIKKKINKGFIFNEYVVISEYDIEDVPAFNVKYKNTLHIGKKINSLDNLEIGDYVVHRSHGIGVYNGVVTLSQGDIIKDYVQINYYGNDKVYVPVEKISNIYKYTDKDGAIPHINKLSSTSWEIKKRQAVKKIKDITDELMKLYAIRANTKGEGYKDYPEEEVFASEFRYEETKDQTNAINDCLNDLRSQVPMDRLLCGDVGFGKTEVAFRAMFKTVLNNKQVMYLCPTTILSKQQYNSALVRFSSFPITIELLNRYTSPNEVKRILDDLERGKVDILFGTHRLLSDDVKCKKLGMLVVDEEQRFGVTHKEKIKKFKNDVNVLTLSATPIPRTLKMAVSGLRDLSIIDTAPVNRYPVQTYVIAENDLIVKDAIYKELARKGQVFVLYNKVADISDFCVRLQKLVPEARICFAHGQMSKKELEDIMEDFIQYKADILVCTTIIETGIDITNANTLIIYNADCFGLSQLYQIRGRVGRSDKIAYAYLLYDKSKVLNDIAVKRLQAIKDFTELGSGYRIAMRDMSLRGAGDILGSEQAGFVDSIGISLYMKLVDEEIRKLKGEEVIEDESNKSLVSVSTHISDSYVSDESVKIEIHKLINEVSDINSFNHIKSILEDRFGMVTDDMEVYMYEEWFEKLASMLGIKKVVQNSRLVEVEIPEDVSNKLKGDKLFLEAYNINPRFSLKYVNKMITISLIIKQGEKHFLYYFVPLLDLINKDINDL